MRADSTRECDAQQGVGHFVFYDEFASGRVEFLQRKWQFNFEEFCSLLKSFPMLRPAKWFAIEDANRLEQTVAVKKSAVKDGNDRLFFGNKHAIKENDHIYVLAKITRHAEEKIYQCICALKNFRRLCLNHSTPNLYSIVL